MVSDERWRGREQGARRGYKIRKKELQARRRAARRVGKTQKGGCAVTALAVCGVVTGTVLSWRGLGG